MEFTKQAAEQAAKAVTVRIITLQNTGSGVIIKKQGNLYTVATNRHVVCGKNRPLCNNILPDEKYIITTPDGKQHEVKVQTVKILPNNLDLAIMQFNSDGNYAVARIANSDTLKVGDAVYIAGFPDNRLGNFTLTTGEILAALNKRIEGDLGGYTIIYNAITQAGTSGGGVFNTEGKVVGIHGVGDIYQQGTFQEGRDDYEVKYLIHKKIGLFNRGIPINWLVLRGKAVGVKLDGSTSFQSMEVTKVKPSKTSDEYFISGVNKFIEPGRDVKAGERSIIALLTKAINLNPKNSFAYFLRGVTYYKLYQYKLALMDYNQAISLNPKYKESYKARAILKAYCLNDVKGGLTDISQVIALDPKDVNAYNIRSILKEDILDGTLNTDIFIRMFINYQDALADINQAIALDPKVSVLYSDRGNIKYSLKDWKGALADYNQAITLDPKDDGAYYNRGSIKIDSKDWKGALADYNQAIAISPYHYQYYHNRAVLKMSLKNWRGALADFNQVIILIPYSPTCYNNRGILKEQKLNDRVGAIADFRQAARIARRQPYSTFALKQAISGLHRLGTTE